MPEYLFIRLQNSTTGPMLEWLLFKDKDEVIGNTVPQTPENAHSQIPEAANARKTIAFVPGEDILLSEVILPKKQLRHLNKVLPFLIEDQLADEISGMHFALSPPLGAERYALASVQNMQLDKWQQVFAGAALQVDYMIPEMLGAPLAGDSWSIIADGNRVILRNGIYSGIAAESSSFIAYLSAALNSYRNSHNGSAPQITVYHGQNPDTQLANLLGSLKQSYDNKTMPNGSLELLATEFLSKNAGDNLNLLQGKRESRHRTIAQHSEWRRIAVIAGIWFVVQFAFMLAQGFYYNYQDAKLDTQITGLYQKLFPEDKKIINPVQQMKTHLSAGDSGSGSNFLNIFGKASYQLQQQVGAHLKIKNIGYSEDNGKIVLTLEAANISEINKFVQNLKNAQLSASADSLNNDKNMVSGQITISSGGSK